MSEEIKREADIRAQQLQIALLEDRSFPTKIGKKTYKCKYLNSWTQRKITNVLLKAEAIDENGGIENVFKAVNKSGTLAPKVVSYLILRHPIKVKLFHWLFWRYLDMTTNSRDLYDPLLKALKAADVNFFLTNMGLMSEIVMTRKIWTAKEVAAIQANQKLGHEQGGVKSSE